MRSLDNLYVERRRSRSKKKKRLSVDICIKEYSYKMYYYFLESFKNYLVRDVTHLFDCFFRWKVYLYIFVYVGFLYSLRTTGCTICY